MAKNSFSLKAGLARLVKAAMVAVLLPLAIGLLQGILGELELTTASGSTFREWIGWGFVTYVGLHVLLYRPVALFRVSHRLFSTLAVWLFGGQVASTEGSGGGRGKGAKGGKGEAAAQGSTLVAFSPYVIPLYTILVSAGGWFLRRWLGRAVADGPVSFCLGATMAFHWLMTADDLQRQRERWHVETYLLAIGLVFLVTLLLAGACLPWAVPEFSFARAFADGISRAQGLYTTLVQRLFL
ncbi:MAG: hypothetical protein HYT90_05510 [Candidatus Omnitrophica bacterium]|nr:hypothetical protein [Candidatus Omnitrophota bacterium]